MSQHDNMVSVTLPKVLRKLSEGLAKNRALFERARNSRSSDALSQANTDGLMRLHVEVFNRSMMQAISEISQCCIAYRFIAKEFESLEQSEADSKAVGFEEFLSGELAQMFIRLGESLSAGSSHKTSKNSQSNTDKKDEIERILKGVSNQTLSYAVKYVFKNIDQEGGAA